MTNVAFGGPIRAIGGKRPSCGYQQITSVASATALTVPDTSPNPPPVYAVVQCEGTITTPPNYVRWRDDGTDPTSSIGMQLFVGSELNTHGPLDKLKFIDGAGTNKLNVTYYS